MSTYRYGELVEPYNVVLESKLPVVKDTWETLLEKGTLLSQHLFVVNLLFPSLRKRDEESKASAIFRRITDYYVDYYTCSSTIWTITSRTLPTVYERVMNFSKKKEKWLNYVNKRYKLPERALFQNKELRYDYRIRDISEIVNRVNFNDYVERMNEEAGYY